MESKKLEKPRENGTFSTVQGVMKPDEEGRRVFPSHTPTLPRHIIQISKQTLERLAYIHVLMLPSCLLW